MESDYVIRGRKADQQLILNALPRAIEEYERQTGRSNVKVVLDTETNLPADTCGGVELFALNGRIKVSNTLEARLELIAAQLIPDIRNALFGRNTNRKFTD